MDATYHITTTVFPGQKIEVSTPGLQEGESVEVVVIRKSAGTMPAKIGPSIFDIIAGLKEHRLFQTPKEVDRYINEERDSWDR